VTTALDPALRLQHALDIAYRYLGRRDRTVLEVRRQLEGKAVEPATIDEAIAELADQGYLDDARYALRFVEDRRRLDGWGTERIERKLLAVGVGAEHVRAALGAGVGDDEGHDELAAAVAVLRRRFHEPPETDRDRERALGMLVRKGYELELAYDAVRAFGRDAA
jgi:regulatory protein